MIVTIPFGGHQQAEKDGKQILIPIHPAIALQNRGAIIPITITHPKSVAQKFASEGRQVPSVRVNALIDSGAFGTVITPNLQKHYNLFKQEFKMLLLCKMNKNVLLILLSFNFTGEVAKRSLL